MAFYRRAGAEAKVITKKYLIREGIIYTLRTLFDISLCRFSSVGRAPAL